MFEVLLLYNIYRYTKKKKKNECNTKGQKLKTIKINLNRLKKEKRSGLH